MTVVRNILILLIAAELIGASVLIARRVLRTNPPEVNLQRLDPLTAADLEELRVAARDGSGLEWRTLAEAYLGNGYYLAAEQCFRQVSQQHPRDIQSRYGRGFCLERIGFTKQAREVLQETAVAADPELARTCWYQIGRCFLREENAEHAEKAFRKVLEFPPAAYQLAKLMIRSGRPDEAVELVDLQLAASPRSLKFLQLRRYAAEAMGEPELARELGDREQRSEYQLILEYNQSFISMFASRTGLSKLLSRAMRLRTEGTVQQRQQALEPALQIILPNQLWQYRSVLMAAAHVELGLENTAEAIRLADLVEEHTQGGTDLLDLRAMIAQAQGDHAAALAYWTRAAALAPTSEFYRLMATSPAEIDEAARRRSTALADMYEGIAAWRNDDLARAEEFFDRVGRELDQNATFHFYVGETHRLTGKIEQALAAYESCLQVNPDHGRCLEQQHQLQKSRTTDAVRPVPRQTSQLNERGTAR